MFSQSSTSGTSGTITASWNAPVAGTYVIMFKLEAKTFIRKAVPSPANVHFGFSSSGIAGSAIGLDLVGPPSALMAALFPYLANEWSEDASNYEGRGLLETIDPIRLRKPNAAAFFDPVGIYR